MQITKEEYVVMSSTGIDFCQGVKTIRRRTEMLNVAPSNRLGWFYGETPT